MNPTRKRPFGITLLAIAFIYIGCIGSIALPIIVLAGDATTSGRLIFGGMIHSAFWLRITFYLFVSIWFLFYVAYAVIGFGLWKLKNWARKSVLVLFEIFGALCLLALPIFVKPIVLAAAIVIGIAPFFGWQIWYLKRPRVCFAFGAWPSMHDETSPQEPPPGLSRMGKAGVFIAAVATFALFLVSTMFTAESMIRRSAIYEITLKQAQDSRCVTTMLGKPLTAEWGTQGSWQEGSLQGSAMLRVPVHGPNGKGDLLVEAKKQNGVWKINSLALARGSERTQIEPPISGSNCE